MRLMSMDLNRARGSLLAMVWIVLAMAGCASAPSDDAAPVVVATTAPQSATPTFTPIAIERRTAAPPTSSPDPKAIPVPTATRVPTATPDPTATPTPAVTRTGAGVLVDAGFNLLVGRRVGLIAHRASVVDGAHLATLIDEHPDVELGALFAPEHGLYGTDAAGVLVGDGIDPVTNTPIFSLYGTTRSPSPEALEGIDVLVYDLQDVGVRFYTYVSTLGLAMQAAAAAEIPMVVLDRPNPIGAETQQGATLTADLTSFVGLYPVPGAYGLTSGELASLIKQQALLPGLDELSLEVVAMQNWRRSMRWADTRLPWVPPSPNLPSPDSALLYPGAVLFEATSVSEGRGTDQPFQLIGAPWINAEDLAVTMNGLGLPGVRFEPVLFTPRSIPEAAPSPRFLGEEAHGVRILVTDRSSVMGLEVGLHLLDAILRQGERLGLAAGDIIEQPRGFDQLAGSAAVRTGLIADVDVTQLLASFAADHTAFADLVADVMLYE